MVKKSLLVLLIALIGIIPAFAATWVQVGNGQYVDSASIRPSNAYGTFTFKAKAIADSVPFERHNGRDVWQVTGSMYVDCRDAYIREVSYSMYDSNGSTIYANKASGNQWHNISPSSSAYDLYAYVCKAPASRYDYKYNNYKDYYYRWWN